VFGVWVSIILRYKTVDAKQVIEINKKKLLLYLKRFGESICEALDSEKGNMIAEKWQKK